MTMKTKIFRLLSLALVTPLVIAGLSACGGEDALEPDFKNPSADFMPAADDQSEEATLRRRFYTETGSHLLFNDTLQRTYLGTDINGDDRYFVELLDLAYAVGTSVTSGQSYTYTYLQTFEQKQMLTDFLQQYVLPHLTGSLRPYSWFVSDVITAYNQTSMGTVSVSRVYAASNQRCIAVAGNYLLLQNRTDAQKQTYAQRILNTVIGQLAMNCSDAFGDFYQYSADYYNTDYMRLGYDSKPSNQELLKLGFLSMPSATNFPSMVSDLNSYATLVAQNTEEQLNRTYAAYPIVLQKAALVRRILMSLGYVF